MTAKPLGTGAFEDAMRRASEVIRPRKRRVWLLVRTGQFGELCRAVEREKARRKAAKKQKGSR